MSPARAIASSAAISRHAGGREAERGNVGRFSAVEGWEVLLPM